MGTPWLMLGAFLCLPAPSEHRPVPGVSLGQRSPDVHGLAVDLLVEVLGKSRH